MYLVVHPWIIPTLVVLVYALDLMFWANAFSQGEIRNRSHMFGQQTGRCKLNSFTPKSHDICFCFFHELLCHAYFRSAYLLFPPQPCLVQLQAFTQSRIQDIPFSVPGDKMVVARGIMVVTDVDKHDIAL